jgi:hypothetical protein
MVLEADRLENLRLVQGGWEPRDEILYSRNISGTRKTYLDGFIRIP